MIPGFQWRKIGGVNIFELHGIFADPAASHKREEMREIWNENPSRGLLMNVREVERVDRPGAEVILEMARKASKGSILGHNLSAYFIAEHIHPNEPIPIFEKDREAIHFFRKELALSGRTGTEEKRRFPRIKTALAVEFELKDAGRLFCFEAAVLNLSEGGFYGKFINSRSEELASRTLDPFDLKMLNIRLQLGGEILKMEGKVLRTGTESGGKGGVAVEFYNLGAREGEKIREVLTLKGGEDE